MLRYALRRMLWLFPSVLGVSLITFFLLSLLPVPDDVYDQGDPRGELSARRFEDLPLFFNTNPQDVRSRTIEAIDQLVSSPADSQEARAAESHLVKLGGAALPILLPQLDTLAPKDRIRVALALAPVAKRMGLDHEGELFDRDRVVVFWNRFWDSRGVEFREATATTAVRRYVRYGTEARAAEIHVLDTFALPTMMDMLEEPSTADEEQEVRRLLSLIGHATEAESCPPGGLPEIARCIQRWQRWWIAHETDYVRLVGARRVAAFLSETQYGKWVLESVVLRLGKDAKGRPLIAELRARARVTLGVFLFGVLLAYLFGIPLGTVSAHFRGGLVDRLVALAVLLPYAVSPAVLALLLLKMGWQPDRPTLAAAVILALALLADPTRHQRGELLPVLASDHVRAAVARGAGPWRVSLVHGMRNALLPVVTRAALELPLALSACFVLEHVFRLRGLGTATVEAVKMGDSSWLMALAVLGAAWAVTALVVSDVVYALLDPRMRSTLMKLRGRRA